MFLVGLTGNYGMGKSTVLALFKKCGVIAIDADTIVESLLKEKDVLEKIRALLGDRVFNKNGHLSKKKVTDLIFKDKTLRHSLEDILHPLVFQRVENFLEKMNGKKRIAMIEVPLLYERGYEDRFDRTITIYTDEEVALNRLEKHGVKREEAILRLKAQFPIEEKIKRADYVIDNNGTTEETLKQVEMIYNKLLKEAEDGDNKRSRGLQRELS